jgi:hypothetical protein
LTEREQQQAQALKACVVDAKLAAADWDVRFITSLDYFARQQRKRWLTDEQRKQLRRMLVRYTLELAKAGKHDLIFSEPNK